MEHTLGEAMTVVGRAHLVPELLKPLAIGGGDLRVDGVEEGQRCE